MFRREVLPPSSGCRKRYFPPKCSCQLANLHGVKPQKSGMLKTLATYCRMETQIRWQRTELCRQASLWNLFYKIIIQVSLAHISLHCDTSLYNVRNWFAVLSSSTRMPTPPVGLDYMPYCRGKECLGYAHSELWTLRPVMLAESIRELHVLHK